MLSSFVTVLALAASVSNVAARPTRPTRHGARGYRQDAEILEDYTPYHVRYLALNCQGQHNTQFFEDCCHPLLRWQKLSDRPSKCIPSASASSAAVIAEPTATPIDEDPIPDYDDDCEDESTSAPAPTTSIKSEVYSAPAPTTKAQTTSQKPETTSHKAESTPSPTSTRKSTTADPEPTQGSGGDENTGGFATFFEQNGVAGACGKVHSDNDKVVALDYRRYGNTGERSSDCGRTVVITNTDNGKSVTAVVADACPTCKNSNSLDLSHGAFDQIADRVTGMVPIKWHFA